MLVNFFAEASVQENLDFVLSESQSQGQATVISMQTVVSNFKTLKS